MSYIRPASNPEGLYIIGTSDLRGRGAVNIMTPDCDGTGLSLMMPPSVFHGLLLRWKEACYCGEDVKYRGARLHQITRKELGLKEYKSPKDWFKYKLDQRTLQWRLTYDRWKRDQYVDAWLVTWMYIARDVEDRVKADHKPRRRQARR